MQKYLNYIGILVLFLMFFNGTCNEKKTVTTQANTNTQDPGILAPSQVNITNSNGAPMMTPGTLLPECDYDVNIPATYYFHVYGINNATFPPSKMVFNSTVLRNTDIQNNGQNLFAMIPTPLNQTFFIDLFVVYDNCNECCGKLKLEQLGSQVVGCTSSHPEIPEKGRPSIYLTSNIFLAGENHGPLNLSMHSVNCICDCDNNIE